jgi:3-hydroxybutyryl-CoA dehydrogenase
MGPLELADFVGLDVVLAIAQILKKELEDSRFRIPSLLRKLVSDGQVGRKSKLGIYDYSGEVPVFNPNATMK